MIGHGFFHNTNNNMSTYSATQASNFVISVWPNYYEPQILYAMLWQTQATLITSCNLDPEQLLAKLLDGSYLISVMIKISTVSYPDHLSAVM